MAKPKPAWLSFLPGGLDPSRFRFDELRAVKKLHALLTEKVPGPAGIVEYIGAFRFLLLFGITCVFEDRYPPLTRCWKDLEKRFMNDPAFEDGVFVQSWVLMDFPFGPGGETTLDYFEMFLKETDDAPKFRQFIDAARKSRLGLYQDVLRTKKVAKFRELFTGNVVSAFPSIEDYGQGEILLTRALAYGDQVFMFGDPKGFPKETRSRLEGMVENKLIYFDNEKTPVAQYEAFMKLAGPYWMSCVTKNEDAPILDPDYYLTYFDQGVLPHAEPQKLDSPWPTADASHEPLPASAAAAIRSADSISSPYRIEQVKSTTPNVGRNDPCWCGSGKKFKKCHLGEKPVGGLTDSPS